MAALGNIKMLLLCTFFTLLLTTTSLAEEYSVNGFDVRIYYEQKRHDLYAWGWINGQLSCKRLKYSFEFYNSQSNWYTTVNGILHDFWYTGNFRTSSKNVANSNKEKKYWDVTSLNVYCLD